MAWFGTVGWTCLHHSMGLPLAVRLWEGYRTMIVAAFSLPPRIRGDATLVRARGSERHYRPTCRWHDAFWHRAPLALAAMAAHAARLWFRLSLRAPAPTFTRGALPAFKP